MPSVAAPLSLLAGICDRHTGEPTGLFAFIRTREYLHIYGCAREERLVAGMERVGSGILQ